MPRCPSPHHDSGHIGILHTAVLPSSLCLSALRPSASNNPGLGPCQREKTAQPRACPRSLHPNWVAADITAGGRLPSPPPPPRGKRGAYPAGEWARMQLQPAASRPQPTPGVIPAFLLRSARLSASSPSPSARTITLTQPTPLAPSYRRLRRQCWVISVCWRRRGRPECRPVTIIPARIFFPRITN